MSIQRIKRDLEEIREAVKPENPKGLIIIYDHRIRGDSEKIRPESILEINGKDVSHLSNEEKEEMLSVADVHIYLPEKDSYPGANCDDPAN